MLQLLLLSFILCLSIVGSAQATNAQSFTNDPSDHDGHKQPIDSYGMMEMGAHSPKGLLVEGEEAFRSGDLGLAMRKVKQSMLLDNDDMDAHCLYANILEAQLDNQIEKDPNLFNKTVEEWLGVMRNRYGEEKHMRWHGINPFGDLYHDDDRSIFAKTELVNLTGSAPGTLETDAHYLKRVLRPSTNTVTANVMKKGKNSSLSTPVAAGPKQNSKENQ